MSCAHDFEEFDVATVVGEKRVVSTRCRNCGVRVRETIIGDSVRKVEVKLRPTWPWVNAAELLTLNLPVRLCPHCLAAPGECVRCHGAGVIAA